MATKIKTLDGIDIFVDDKGKFFAEIGEKTVRRTSLKPIENEIIARRSAVKVINITSNYRGGFHIRPYEIIGFEKSGHARTKDGDILRRYDLNLYICSSEQQTKIDQMMKEQENFIKKWDALIETLTEVNEHNFEKVHLNGG